MRTTLAAHPFAHGAVHDLEGVAGAAAARVVPMIDSYHVSRQNTNTGRLTAAMFDEVVATARGLAART